MMSPNSDQPEQESSPAFHLVRGDYTFHAEFSGPQLSLFRDTTRLYDELLRSLASRGLTLADIRAELNPATPAEWSIFCSLLSGKGAFRVRPERAEVSAFDLVSESATFVADAGLEAIASLGNVDSQKEGPNYRAYLVSIGLHGELESSNPQDLISRFASGRRLALGPSLGVGVVLYCGPQDGRSFSSVTMEPSALVTGGLFVRLHASWDPQFTSLGQIKNRASSFVDAAFRELDLRR